MDLNELEKLLDLLRRKGVTEFEGHNAATFQDFKIKLGPAVEAPAEEIPQDPVKAAAKNMFGKDGLSREQQAELYGQEVDEFEG